MDMATLAQAKAWPGPAVPQTRSPAPASQHGTKPVCVVSGLGQSGWRDQEGPDNLPSEAAGLHRVS